MCAFSKGRARSSVLGVDPVPGIRSQVPRTRDLAPDTWQNAWLTLRNPHTGYAGYRMGRTRIPVIWYPGPMSHSRISNLNKALLLC